MEFTKEFIEEHKLEENQIKAISEFASNHIAEIKNEYDGKASKDADAILDGATSKIAEITGVNRDQGEKIGDYINKAWSTFSESKSTELDNKIKELDEKIKNAGTDDSLKAEYQGLKEKYEALQKKEADFDELLSSGIKDKYEELKGQHSTLKIKNAFNSVKPNFPDTVNSYEASAKWGDFEKEVLDKYTLELVDNEWLAIDKENKHKQVKLSDLVSRDTNINSLLEGRKQGGPGGKEKDLQEIEGVPFKVPAGANSAERSKLINEHLDEKGISKTNPERAKLFMELNNKILKSGTA